jgi:hypothetical protein
MKTTLLRSSMAAIVIFCLFLVFHVVRSVAQQVSQEMIDMEEKRLEMQIKDADRRCFESKHPNQQVQAQCEERVDRIKDRLRLLRSDPDQYFYNRGRQSERGGVSLGVDTETGKVVPVVPLRR